MTPSGPAKKSLYADSHYTRNDFLSKMAIWIETKPVTIQVLLYRDSNVHKIHHWLRYVILTKKKSTRGSIRRFQCEYIVTIQFHEANLYFSFFPFLFFTVQISFERKLVYSCISARVSWFCRDGGRNSVEAGRTGGTRPGRVVVFLSLLRLEEQAGWAPPVHVAVVLWVAAACPICPLAESAPSYMLPFIFSLLFSKKISVALVVI